MEPEGPLGLTCSQEDISGFYSELENYNHIPFLYEGGTL
jgi:hypothetical protein